LAFKFITKTNFPQGKVVLEASVEAAAATRAIAASLYILLREGRGRERGRKSDWVTKRQPYWTARNSLPDGRN